MVGDVGTVYVEGMFDSAPRSFSVFCPEGFVATGWGHSGKSQSTVSSPFDTPTDGLMVVASEPIPLEGWVVRLKAVSGGMTLARVSAVCMRNPNF